MAGTNSVHIIGEVLRDADPTSSRSQAAVYFCLKVPSMFRKGELVYVDCVAFSETFDQFDAFLERGETVEVEGSLQYRKFYDERGNDRRGLEVVADRVTVWEDEE